MAFKYEYKYFPDRAIMNVLVSLKTESDCGKGECKEGVVVVEEVKGC